MSVKVHKCLVTITRANVAYPRIVKCALGAVRLLVIPVEDFAVPQAGGRKQMKLRVPDRWFIEVVHEDYNMLCRKDIDLDKFDELPWA